MSHPLPRLEVFFSDVHFPFEDKRAWALTLKILRRLQPDLVWIGGDFVDFYATSRWDTKPARRLRLQEEIDAGVAGLKQIRKAVGKDARIVWQQGNHEERLVKYLWSRSPELSVLRALSFDELFSLRDVQVEFISDYRAQAVGALWHLHGDKAPGGSVNPARTKMAKIHDNIIFGHHHRFQVEYQRDLNGVVRGSFANGCLCGLQPEYDPFNDWSQGISVIHYAKGGVFHVDQVVYMDHKGKYMAMVDGTMMEV
jgi:UDP-2,3-diacylglucosamine pyrophosphatase LpxH